MYVQCVRTLESVMIQALVFVTQPFRRLRTALEHGQHSVAHALCIFCCLAPTQFSFLKMTHGNNNNINHGNGNNNNNSDHSKKEFRKYLEKSGVLDALTKVLVGLYEEPDRPSNSLEYIKRYLGAPAAVDVDALKRENEELKQKVKQLQEQLTRR